MYERLCVLFTFMFRLKRSTWDNCKKLVYLETKRW